MATRSMIGYKCEDGKIRASYCHWDGYIDGVGAKLMKYYNSDAGASRFASMQPMSELRDAYMDCKFYKDEEPEDRIYESTSDFCNVEEFNYIWDGDMWLVSCHETDNKFLPLSYFVSKK